MASTSLKRATESRFITPEHSPMAPNLILPAIAVQSIKSNQLIYRFSIRDEHWRWQSHQGMGRRCPSNESWREGHFDHYTVRSPIIASWRPGRLHFNQGLRVVIMDMENVDFL